MVECARDQVIGPRGELGDRGVTHRRNRGHRTAANAPVGSAVLSQAHAPCQRAVYVGSEPSRAWAWTASA